MDVSSPNFDIDMTLWKCMTRPIIEMRKPGAEKLVGVATEMTKPSTEACWS
jgi:hypothetical protein